MMDWERYRYIQNLKVESRPGDSLLLLTFTTINANGVRRKLRMTVEADHALELGRILNESTEKKQ